MRDRGSVQHDDDDGNPYVSSGGGGDPGGWLPSHPSDSQYQPRTEESPSSAGNYESDCSPSFSQVSDPGKIEEKVTKKRRLGCLTTIFIGSSAITFVSYTGYRTLEYFLNK